MLNQKNDSTQSSLLPDFSQAEVLFKLLVVIEFLALVFAFLTISSWKDFLSHIGFISIFLLMIALLTATSLFALKRMHFLRSALYEVVFSFFLSSLFILLILFYLFEQDWFYLLFPVDLEQLLFYVMKFELVNWICLTIGFYLMTIQLDSKKRLIAQNQARLEALQARIRPHFLFNSLNTVASLVHDMPEQAESAIIHLSDLFRASLSDVKLIPLKQEIELTKSYIQLEALRLEERLKVNWHCVEEDMDVQIPPLTLQPLVENAIYHGIEPLEAGGEITIQSAIDGSNLKIKIHNPVNKNMRSKSGHQIAVKNIHERLTIAFSGGASLSTQENEDGFVSTVKIPL